MNVVKNHFGLKKVYHDPPSNIHMVYPCAVMEMEPPTIQYADNIPYQWTYRWSITIIDQNGTKGEFYIRKMLELPYCSPGRRFVTDNLYHFMCTIYFKGGISNG